jgi:hypothetical protein
VVLPARSGLVRSGQVSSVRLVTARSPKKRRRKMCSKQSRPDLRLAELDRVSPAQGKEKNIIFPLFHLLNR